ncbi:MAG: fimbrillin family protein [Muribaculum sp.]|nr:fimbrillin family protein [Muribaculum sp.]
MKKGLIYAAAVASMALTACTNDEVMDLNIENDEISFRSCMSTRGSETTINDLTSVYVTSTIDDSSIYFSDVEYAINENGKYHSTSGTYRWPGFKALTFYAHYPSTKALKANVKGTVLEGIQPSMKISEQYDLVTAKTSGDNSMADGVDLVFSHNMTQVEILAVNTNPAYTYNIKGVKFGRFVSNASFDMKKIGTEQNPWILTSVKSDYTITYSTPIQLKGKNSEPTSLMNGKGNAMLIPQNLTPWDKSENSHGSYIAVLIQINAASQIFPNATGKYAWAAIPVDFQLEAGKKYQFTLDFSNGAGVVAPPEDFSNTGDIEEPLDNVVDNDMAKDYLGKTILEGEVTVVTGIGDWENGNTYSKDF